MQDLLAGVSMTAHLHFQVSTKPDGFRELEVLSQCRGYKACGQFVTTGEPVQGPFIRHARASKP
ncbi:MAG: hypothetical protein H7338_15390 [Candidatus Sericytochromatia bacterium]|nr:hypothetical protein [Candidatus Sericytochromatia bacterium]